MRNVSREVKKTLNENEQSNREYIKYAISSDCILNRTDYEKYGYSINIFGNETTVYKNYYDFKDEQNKTTGLTTYDLVNNELWVWLDDGEKPEDTWAFDLYPLNRVEYGKNGGGPYAVFDISNWTKLELSEWDYILVHNIMSL